MHDNERVRDTAIYAALIALLLLSWGIAHLDLGEWGTAIGIGIACIKAVLVALFFMRLKRASGLSRVFALAGLGWLAILITLSLSDYLTRGWTRIPGPWPQDSALKSTP